MLSQSCLKYLTLHWRYFPKSFKVFANSWRYVWILTTFYCNTHVPWPRSLERDWGFLPWNLFAHFRNAISILSAKAFTAQSSAQDLRRSTDTCGYLFKLWLRSRSIRQYIWKVSRKIKLWYLCAVTDCTVQTRQRFVQNHYFTHFTPQLKRSRYSPCINWFDFIPSPSTRQICSDSPSFDNRYYPI